jgi:hypothetical protein
MMRPTRTLRVIAGIGLLALTLAGCVGDYYPDAHRPLSTDYSPGPYNGAF